MLAYVVGVTALGMLFKFPMAAQFMLPFAGVGLAIATRYPLTRVLAWILFSSAIATQATSIFVTPFTWPLRLGFFAALFGAFGALFRSQTNDL